MCHWTIHYSVHFQQTEKHRDESVGRKQTKLRPWQTRYVQAFQQAISYHCDHHWFTLRSLMPKLILFMKIYGNLSNTTTFKDPKTLSVCEYFHAVWLAINTCSVNYGPTEWQQRGFTENFVQILLSLFNLKHISPLLPLFSLGLHRELAICLMSYTQTHTVRTAYEPRNTDTHKKKNDLGKKQTVVQIFTQKHAITHPRACSFSSLWANLFLLQQHRSYQVCLGGRESNGLGLAVVPLSVCIYSIGIV